MSNQKIRLKDGKDRILSVAYDMLTETGDPKQVTVREICKRAEVGIGLISYHFPSKDAMLMEAVGSAMDKVIEKFGAFDKTAGLAPRMAFKNLLLEMMNFALEHVHLVKLSSRYELTEGEIRTPSHLIPYLESIIDNDESHLRMIAFSMVCNIQSAILRPDAIKSFIGLDISNREDRLRYIEWVLESHGI